MDKDAEITRLRVENLALRQRLYRIEQGPVEANALVALLKENDRLVDQIRRLSRELEACRQDLVTKRDGSYDAEVDDISRAKDQRRA